METQDTPVEPCKYFRLHTNTPLDPLEEPVPRAGWGQIPPDGQWRDGYHYFGYIKRYEVLDEQIIVTLEPLVQAQSNSDRDLRWQPLKLFNRYTMKFDHCVLLEQCLQFEDASKRRMRFYCAKTKELIIISRGEEIDTEITDALIAELSKKPE